MLLAGMVRAGHITLARYGKYIPTGSTDSSSLREHMKKNHLLMDGREDGTESVESVPVPASASEPEAEAEPILAALPHVPPKDFLRFVHAVADALDSRL